MKSVFIGTVKSSYIALETLLENGVDVDGVFTIFENNFNSDHIDLRPLCKKYKIPVYGIKNINDSENIKILEKINPDYIFIIGISQLIKKEILEIPKWGCIGFHPTLLPANRGRAVIPWTILQANHNTGITLFKIDEGMDSGDIIAQRKIKLDSRENSTSFYKKILINLKKLIEETSGSFLKGKITTKKQNDEEATYCAIRRKEDGLIDWGSSAEEIDGLIRATSKPYPGAYTYHKGEELIIWESELVEKDNWAAFSGQRVEIIPSTGVKVKTGKGLLLIKKIQYQGQEHFADEFFKVLGKRFE